MTFFNDTKKIVPISGWYVGETAARHFRLYYVTTDGLVTTTNIIDHTGVELTKRPQLKVGDLVETKHTIYRLLRSLNNHVPKNQKGQYA